MAIFISYPISTWDTIYVAIWTILITFYHVVRMFLEKGVGGGGGRWGRGGGVGITIYKYLLRNRDYYMAIFISYPVSTRDTHISPRAEGPRADMGQGLLWGMVWKLPCHNLFITQFSFWQVCLFNIICGQRQDRRVLRMWWYGFLPGQKGRITHVTHYHTFCLSRFTVGEIYLTSK